MSTDETQAPEAPAEKKSAKQVRIDAAKREQADAQAKIDKARETIKKYEKVQAKAAKRQAWLESMPEDDDEDEGDDSDDEPERGAVDPAGEDASASSEDESSYTWGDDEARETVHDEEATTRPDPEAADEPKSRRGRGKATEPLAG